MSTSRSSPYSAKSLLSTWHCVKNLGPVILGAVLCLTLEYAAAHSSLLRALWREPRESTIEVQTPGAAPSGSCIVLLLAIGSALALPIVAVIAMLVAQAPSPTDALHCFVSGCVVVLIAHVLRPFLGRVAAVGFRCAKLQSPPPATTLCYVEFAWDFGSG